MWFLLSRKGEEHSSMYTRKSLYLLFIVLQPIQSSIDVVFVDTCVDHRITIFLNPYY